MADASDLFQQIMAASQKLTAMPELFLGSSNLFSADSVLHFTHDGCDYLLAHPLVWKKIDTRDEYVARPQGAGFSPFCAQTIWDLDADPVKFERATTALAAAMGYSL